MFKLFSFSPLTSILLTIALWFALFSSTPTWFRVLLFTWLLLERVLLHLGLFFIAHMFKHPEKLIPILMKLQK